MWTPVHWWIQSWSGRNLVIISCCRLFLYPDCDPDLDTPALTRAISLLLLKGHPSTFSLVTPWWRFTGTLPETSSPHATKTKTASCGRIDKRANEITQARVSFSFPFCVQFSHVIEPFDNAWRLCAHSQSKEQTFYHFLLFALVMVRQNIYYPRDAPVGATVFSLVTRSVSAYFLAS